MKRNSLKSGFTLVELLVVIAIIASLAGMSAVAYGGFLKSAKKQQSQALVDALENAIEQYHTEYGSFPPPVRTAVAAGATFDSDDTTDMPVLLAELTGENATINYKGKNFLSIDDAEGGQNGLTRDAADAVEFIFDPQGQPYTLDFNSDYNENGIPIPAGYLNAGTNIKAKVLIYNAGIDGAAGTKDDVISWN